MFKLKELRQEAGITRAELSRRININQGTLANYENELRQVDYQTIIQLSEFFEVSTDFLLGKDDSAPTTPFRALTLKEKNIIDRYRALSEKSKDLFYELLLHILKTEQGTDKK
jgi:transcriptional regulator with XRE-family HTH domain